MNHGNEWYFSTSGCFKRIRLWTSVGHAVSWAFVHSRFYQVFTSFLGFFVFSNFCMECFIDPYTQEVTFKVNCSCFPNSLANIFANKFSVVDYLVKNWDLLQGWCLSAVKCVFFTKSTTLSVKIIWGNKGRLFMMCTFLLTKYNWYKSQLGL